MKVLKSPARPVWLAGALLLMTVLVTACYPVRLEADWPGVSTVGDEQNILLSYNDRIVMIDPMDGTPVRLRNPDGEVRVDSEGNPRIWEFQSEAPAANQFFANPILFDENTLLAVDYNLKVYKIGLLTARMNSSSDVRRLPEDGSANQTGNNSAIPIVGTGIGGISDPARNNDLLYFGMNARNLIAVDAANLIERWQVNTNHGVWSEPLIVDDVMYFASLDHFLYAINPETGAEIWKLDLQGAVPGNAVFYDGYLYIGSFARKIFKISTAGDIVDEFETANWVWGAPTIVDDVLYAGDMSGNVYALRITGGGFEPLWQAKIADRGIRSSPLVSGEYLIVGSRDHKVYWVNREEGSVFFSRELAGEVLSDLLLIEPSEFVDIPEPYVVVSSVANNELLVAFTLQNGEREWTYGR